MLLDNRRILILEEFVTNYTPQLTASHIAQKKGLNQKTVANTLHQLEEEHLLRSKTSGKNKLYSLNLDNKANLIQFLSAIEHLRTLIFYEKNPHLKEITTQLLHETQGTVALFGSYADGTQTDESDLDIFISGNYSQKQVTKLSSTYNLTINVKNYPQNLFTQALAKKDILLTEVIKKHILLLNIQLFIEQVITFYYGKN